MRTQTRKLTFQQMEQLEPAIRSWLNAHLAAHADMPEGVTLEYHIAENGSGHQFDDRERDVVLVHVWPFFDDKPRFDIPLIRLAVKTSTLPMQVVLDSSDAHKTLHREICGRCMHYEMEEMERSFDNPRPSGIAWEAHQEVGEIHLYCIMASCSVDVDYELPPHVVMYKSEQITDCCEAFYYRVPHCCQDSFHKLFDRCMYHLNLEEINEV